MAVLDRENGKIYYTVQGPADGAVLLMLRGLGRSSRYWLSFDKIMARDFRVITFDARGLGRSTQPMEWTDSLETLADDCLAILDHLQIKKFHMFGLSFGGMIAATIAAEAPNRILSLAIAASSSADGHRFRLNPRVLPKLLNALRKGRFQDALLETVVPDLILRSWRPEIQTSWVEILKIEGFPLSTTLKQLRLCLTYKIKGRLDKGLYPILFLHGSMDRFVPVANSIEMQKLVPRAKIRIVKGAGHEIALGYEHELSKVLRVFAETPNKLV
ncbi:MAG: alpha/beta hydrolase [Chitinophagaceae bacterium]|nr:alpha/beta hydrolase [Oligoflexus sp.]